MDLKLPSVDVRDVAEMHVKAMTDKSLSNESRVIAVNFAPEFLQLVAWLREEFGPKGYTFPKYKIPNWVIKGAAFFSPMMKMMASWLGKDMKFSNDKMKALLGKEPRPLKEAFIDMANSLIEKGLIPNKQQQQQK